ncbi:MAG TPA: BACON domain-containing carbohydrate-binding protein [Thermodesulfobacteriota bacterium]|nr:BACON domain-containing carbohydrate-binding protein [Thermodesulfobacteriota bacterium]
MRTISIFVLAVLLLAPMSISATESDETQETIEALSNDEAGTWEAIGPQEGKIYAVVIDPSNPSIIYTGTDVGVFKSTNAGDSWTASGLPQYDVNILAIDPSNPSILYASTDDDVFKTTNGGGSWRDIVPSPGLHLVNFAVVIDPSDPSIFYLSNNYRGGVVFKVTGGGSDWNGTCLSGYFAYALAIDPTNTSIIYAGTNGGVFKSTNWGESWSPINNGLTNTHVTILAIDPSDPSTIYAGTNGGVFESTNGGGNWSTSGLANTHVTSLAIDPSNSDIIYAGTDGGGVFKSSSTEESPSLTVSKSGTGDGTITSTPPGINCGSTCKANFTTGTNVALTASADSGSTFTGWSGGGCSGTDPCTITLSSDTTIGASFALSGNCAYTISPANKTFTSRGGSVSIKVSATGLTNCPTPSVIEDAEWISVSGIPTWKANKETVRIAVQKNPSSQSRTAVVSIGGENLTLEQDGAICQLTALKPSSAKYPNTGGSGSFDITVSPQDCGWNVATTFVWIHLDTTAGTGKGTAAFHLDANGTDKNRTGKINVSLAQNVTKKKTFTVNESK